MTRTPDDPGWIDSATFAPVRIEPVARRAPRRAVVAIALAGVIVVTGLTGRLAALTAPDANPSAVRPARADAAVAADAAQAAQAKPIRTAPPGPRTAHRAAGPWAGRLVLVVAPLGAYVHVNGDVSDQSVAWVFVTLERSDGSIAGQGSRAVMRAFPDVTLYGTARFSAHFRILDSFTTGDLWIQADAYDAAGAVVLSRRLVVPAQAV